MELKHSLHLILIRHGMTEFNIEKKYMGYTDEPVITEKLNEYEEVRTILEDQHIDQIYCSDLIRCQQTAAFLFPEKDLILDHRLREIHFGDWEGKTYEQLKDQPAYCQWLSNWENEHIPNGESGPVFRNRVLQFLQQEILLAENREKTIVLVSHGGVIRHIVSQFCNDIEYWDVEVNFGEAIALNITEVGGKWSCMSSSVVPTVEKGNM